MNAKISIVAIGTALTLAACSVASPAAPSPTRPPTQSPTSSPTTAPTSAPVGTGSQTAPPPADTSSLNGRQFLSERVTGAPRPLVAGTQIRLDFQDESLTANAGCNIIGGNYSLEGRKLVFTGASMTEMACDEPRMEQDDWLVSFLGSEPVVILVDDQLTLSAGGTTIALLDSEVANPDQPLTGRTWTLTSLISGDAVSSVPMGVVATIAFGEAGDVDVNPGCNNGAGSYSVDGTSISFRDVITTKMACMGPAMQVENAVLEVLSMERLTFSIDANVLTISAEDVGLQFSAS